MKSRVVIVLFLLCIAGLIFGLNCSSSSSHIPHKRPVYVYIENSNTEDVKIYYQEFGQQQIYLGMLMGATRKMYRLPMLYKRELKLISIPVMNKKNISESGTFLLENRRNVYQFEINSQGNIYRK